MLFQSQIFILIFLPAALSRFAISSSLSTNQIYVAGGQDGTGADQTTVFEYTIGNNGAVPGPAGTPSGTWLTRGGAIATLGGEPVWRGPEPWKRVLVDVVNEWTNDALGDPNSSIWGGEIYALSAAGYRVEEHEIAENTTWTCDSIVGFMYSTSIASTRVLGQNAAAFEAHLRAALLACEPAGKFPGRQRFGFTLGVRQ